MTQARHEIKMRKLRTWQQVFICGVCVFCTLIYFSRQPLQHMHVSEVLTEPSRCDCTDNGNTYDLCFESKTSKEAPKFKFDCRTIPHLKRLKLLDHVIDKEVPKIENILGKDGPLFATGSSSNHFEELKGGIGSIHHYFNTSTIIVYDLGLNDGERTLLSKYCNVQIRQFNFNLYSNVSGNIRNLMEYRWKALIIAELLNEFPSFIWGDSSVRWKTGNLTELYTSVTSGGLSSYLLLDNSSHSNFAATNPGMYDYLPASIDGQKTVTMFGGGFVLVVRSATATEVLKWTVLCSLEQNCMAPSGSQLVCNMGLLHQGQYANCHRYDQSAVNLVLADMFGYNDSKYTFDISKLATVSRGEKDGQPKICANPK